MFSQIRILSLRLTRAIILSIAILVVFFSTNKVQAEPIVEPAASVSINLPSEGITAYVAPDITPPTITKLTAIVDDQERISTDGKLSVAQNSTTSLIKLGVSEPITIEDSPGVNIKIDGIDYPYGTVTLDTTDESSKTLLVTPIGSNGTAALTGVFDFTFLAGSIVDLSGNENEPMIFRLNVDGTKPDLKSISTSIGGIIKTYAKEETIQAELGASVGSITAILTEDSRIIDGSSGEISITGALASDDSIITARYGSFVVNNDQIIILPDAGNNILAKLGTFKFTVSEGIIEDLVGNKNDKFEILMTVSDTTSPTAEIKYDDTGMTQNNVTATLINPSEKIIITNNDGLPTYTFKENRSFVFEIKDLSGNTATITATVNNIDRIAPHLENYLHSIEIISPSNNDGRNDFSIIDIKFSERVSAKINILDKDGNWVKNIYSSNGVTDPEEKRWYGDNSSGLVSPDGVYTIQIIGIDEALNRFVDTTKTITVDNTPPLITKEPADQTFEATGPLTNPNNLVSPVSTDQYGSTITNYKPLSFPLGTTTVKWYINDSADNLTLLTSKVTIIDTTGPSLNVPADMLIESPLSKPLIVSYEKPTANDLVDEDLEVKCDHPSYSIFNMGVTKVTCTATDNSQNSTTKTFNVELKDTTPPVITLKDYNKDIKTNNNILVEATVNEGSLRENSHLFTKYGEDFEFVATDEALNVTRKMLALYNLDKVKPVITLKGSSNVDILVGGNYDELGATIYDYLDGLLKVSIGGDTVNTAILGSYIVTYDTTDTYGNKANQIIRTVNVVDKEAPVITINGPDLIKIYSGSTYSDQGATAKDNYDKEISVTSEGSVNTNVVGTYTITYNAKDSSGNKATPVIRTIIVERAPSSGGGYYIEPKPQTKQLASIKQEGQVLGAEKFNFTLLLKKGSRSNEVTELQKFLNNLGYDCGIVDGIFGNKTKSAVIKFQLANGLVGDGIVGAKTRAVLNK